MAGKIIAHILWENRSWILSAVLSQGDKLTNMASNESTANHCMKNYQSSYVLNPGGTDIRLQ